MSFLTISRETEVDYFTETRLILEVECEDDTHRKFNRKLEEQKSVLELPTSILKGKAVKR